MDMTGLLVSLISGAVGGNVAGAAMKDKSLGTLGNSLAGIFGGGIGSFLLQVLGSPRRTPAAASATSSATSPAAEWAGPCFSPSCLRSRARWRSSRQRIMLTAPFGASDSWSIITRFEAMRSPSPRSTSS
jgi:uncharacterized membrane protein YeaQ/YmgE (transglycosylase-associated protein family)